uniref:Uncharacterized protein n=1 Tax=Acrobeloides nanus TaxID=290746 RepID=A0A914CZ89_9BILA
MVLWEMAPNQESKVVYPPGPWPLGDRLRRPVRYGSYTIPRGMGPGEPFYWSLQVPTPSSPRPGALSFFQTNRYFMAVAASKINVIAEVTIVKIVLSIGKI